MNIAPLPFNSLNVTIQKEIKKQSSPPQKDTVTMSSSVRVPAWYCCSAWAFDPYFRDGDQAYRIGFQVRLATQLHIFRNYVLMIFSIGVWVIAVITWHMAVHTLCVQIV
jgi:hypothetical protein